MKKIVFFIDSLSNSGGTERVTTVLANYLCNNNYDISILTLNNTGKSFFTLDNKIKVEHLHEKKSNKYTRYLQNILLIKKFYKVYQPDYWIDVCSALSLMSIPALSRTKVKIITWEHFNANVEWNKITSPLARILASKISYKIVTLTETDKEIFEQRFKAKNVLCIPNPITINGKLTPCQSNNKRVLAIGRFEKQKGFDMLLEIWAKCKCKDNGWTLKIIGDGKEKQKLIQLIQSLKLSESVTLAPPTKNIIPEYQNAEIYAMSSRFEGLPLVLIEASTCGLPIISFDCETGPRDIIKNNENGILIKTFDLEEFSLKLDFLTKSPEVRKNLSNKAIEYSKRYNIENISLLWNEILK